MRDWIQSVYTILMYGNIKQTPLICKINTCESKIKWNIKILHIGIEYVNEVNRLCLSYSMYAKQVYMLVILSYSLE
jgi:hypothetical protein